MPPIYSLLQALMDRQQVDLGRIPIVKPQILPQGLPPTNPMPQNTMTPTLPAPTSGLGGGYISGTNELGRTQKVSTDPANSQAQTPGGSALSAFLRQVGLPLGAAAIGSIFPSALPGAAGFSQGFATEQSKQREKQATIDAELAKEQRQRNEPEKPTFAQEQKMKALKAGLKRREVVIGKEFGEPSKYQVKNLSDAISAITESGYDPALFADELKDYEEVIVFKGSEAGTIPRYQLEDALKEGYRLK